MIEGRLNTSADGLERRQSSDAFASPGAGDDGRKRPFSSISGGGAFQNPPSNRTSPAFILPYPPPTQVPPNPPDLAMRQAAPIQFPGATGDVSPEGQPEMMDGISQDGLPPVSSHQVDQLPEIQDAVFNRYVALRSDGTPAVARVQQTNGGCCPQLSRSHPPDLSGAGKQQSQSTISGVAVAFQSSERLLQRVLFHGQPLPRRPDRSGGQ